MKRLYSSLCWRWGTSILLLFFFVCVGIGTSFFLSGYVYRQQINGTISRLRSETIRLESYLEHVDTLLTFNYQKVRANKISSCEEYITEEDRYHLSQVQKELASVKSGTTGGYLPIQELLIFLTKPQLAITNNMVYSLEDMSSLFFHTELYELEKILSDFQVSEQSQQLIRLQGKTKDFILYFKKFSLLGSKDKIIGIGVLDSSVFQFNTSYGESIYLAQEGLNLYDSSVLKVDEETLLSYEELESLDRVSLQNIEGLNYTVLWQPMGRIYKIVSLIPQSQFSQNTFLIYFFTISISSILGILSGIFWYNSKAKVRRISTLLQQDSMTDTSKNISSNKEFEKIRSNIVSLIQQNSDLRLKNEMVNEQIEKHHTLMHDSFVRMLIMGNAESPDFEETIKFYRIDSHFDRYRVMLIQIREWAESHEKIDVIKSVLSAAVKSMLEYPFEICILDDYTVGILFMYQLSDKVMAAAKIHDCMDHLVSVVRESQGIIISAALGRSVHTLHDCLVSYHSARMVLMCSSEEGPHSNDTVNSVSEEDNERMMNILHSLEQGDCQTCLAKFDEMFCPIDEEHNYTAGQRASIMVLFRLFDDTIKGHSQLKKLFEENESRQVKFRNSTTLDDILKEFRTMLAEACQCMGDFSENRKKLTVNRAVQLVYENYTNAELSQSEIANQLGISPSVLSVQFKEITGMNMSLYIRMLRIERVKEYLSQTDWNLERIAELTGFNSLKTMYRVFKAETNMTPTQYRSYIGTNFPDKV